MYTWRCQCSFSSTIQRRWISPSTAAVITAPYTYGLLRRRKTRRRQVMMDRMRRFTAVSLSCPPRGQPIKASVSFGSPIKQFWLQQPKRSCHGNDHREVGVRMREGVSFYPSVVSVALVNIAEERIKGRENDWHLGESDPVCLSEATVEPFLSAE